MYFILILENDFQWQYFKSCAHISLPDMTLDVKGEVKQINKCAHIYMIVFNVRGDVLLHFLFF